MKRRGADGAPTSSNAVVLGRVIVSDGETQPQPTDTGPVWSSLVTAAAMRDWPAVGSVRVHAEPRIDVRHRDLPDGAETTYRTADSALAQAIRSWFDAQLAGHGSDAASASDDADHTGHSEHGE